MARQDHLSRRGYGPEAIDEQALQALMDKALAEADGPILDRFVETMAKALMVEDIAGARGLYALVADNGDERQVGRLTPGRTLKVAGD